MKQKLTKWTLVIVLCVAAVAKSYAQDTSTAKDKWHFLVQPYAIFPVMEGTIGLGELPDVSIDANTSDIFSNLKFVAMVYFEAQNANWSLTSDLIYMNLNQDVAGKSGVVSGEAGAKQFIWEHAGLIRITPWLDAGAGVRLVSINSTLDINVNNTVTGGSGQRSRSTSEFWIDPIIVGRVKLPLGNRWLMQVRGDFGGFGIGSEFTWQAQADLAYRFSKLFHMGLGYRVLGMDYEKGTGTERFLYNVDTFGPALKFSFNF